MNTIPTTNASPAPNPPSHSKNALGESCTKPTIAWLDSTAVFLSFFCCIISICTISFSPLSWHLGFQGQLIIVGLMISIMSQCLMKFVPTSFNLIEARWGYSRLQNYDAILRNSPVAKGTGWAWRVAILIFIALPLGLSVGYKRFLGGESTKIIHPGIRGNMYGLFPPTNTNSAFSENFANPFYIYINSTSSFFEQSVSDYNFPYDAIAKNKATAYGNNLLLLSNDSAAALDLPRVSYLDAIKEKLWESESWTISTSVYGLVVQKNETIEDMRTVESFWRELFAAGASDLCSMGIFRGGISLGLIPFLPSLSQPTSASSLFGFYSPSRVFSISYSSGSQDPEVLAFSQNASLFTVHRQLCNATWQVTANSIQLLSGDCPVDGDRIESAMFSINETAHPRINAQISAPFELDALPITIHSLNNFADSPANTPWKTPSTIMAIAGIYWARNAFLVGKTDTDGADAANISSDFLYTAKEESIRSTRSTLRAHTGLYIILALQPVLTIFLCFFNMLLWEMPLSNDFGIVSILSGVDPISLHLIGGAGLSGKLERPVTLDISVSGKNIKYTLSLSKHVKSTQEGSLQKGVPYS
ncbi:hypothetical protein N431DRAFT_344857 [Stipitochalara longipes BDJ]|nr:hypothetical protein N431DRAFT_344857 [Stipitochalara longipes BDJ]